MVFKKITYDGAALAALSVTTTTTTPQIGDAILDGGDYYIIMHKVINEIDTWLVSPFIGNPNPFIPAT